MATVLVVDDNPGDRDLLQAHLEGVQGIRLEFAGDGDEALALLQRRQPDLILSDLRMPRMSGIELVKHIRHHHPQVPVILITSFGNEQIAVEALRQGAASYVSKNAIDTLLLPTIRDVLQVVHRGHQRDQLMAHLRSHETRLRLGNDPDLIPSLVRYLVGNLERNRLCDPRDLTRVGVALQEAMDNAIYHGNLEIGSELREQDPGLYYRTAEDRRQKPPYRERLVEVLALESPEQVLYRITDAGPGFDPASVPNPTDPDNMDKVSGRGLLLIRTFMDHVEHNDRGNEITMIRRFRRDTPPTGHA
jgi:CheY-like chemotaxis protein